MGTKSLWKWLVPIALGTASFWGVLAAAETPVTAGVPAATEAPATAEVPVAAAGAHGVGNTHQAGDSAEERAAEVRQLNTLSQLAAKLANCPAQHMIWGEVYNQYCVKVFSTSLTEIFNSSLSRPSGLNSFLAQLESTQCRTSGFDGAPYYRADCVRSVSKKVVAGLQSLSSTYRPVKNMSLTEASSVLSALTNAVQACQKYY